MNRPRIKHPAKGQEIADTANAAKNQQIIILCFISTYFSFSLTLSVKLFSYYFPYFPYFSYFSYSSYGQAVQRVRDVTCFRYLQEYAVSHFTSTFRTLAIGRPSDVGRPLAALKNRFG